jgi:hypothetical protein
VLEAWSRIGGEREDSKAKTKEPLWSVESHRVLENSGDKETGFGIKIK